MKVLVIYSSYSSWIGLVPYVCYLRLLFMENMRAISIKQNYRKYEPFLFFETNTGFILILHVFTGILNLRVLYQLNFLMMILVQFINLDKIFFQPT